MNRPLVQGWAYRAACIVVTFHFVCFTWVFFRSPDFQTAFSVLKGIMSNDLLAMSDLAAFGAVKLGLIGLALTVLVLQHQIVRSLREWQWQQSLSWTCVRPFFYFATIACVVLMAGHGPQAFIYFQF